MSTKAKKPLYDAAGNDLALQRERRKSPDQIACERGYQTLTMVEFSPDDHDTSDRIAKRLGFTQTAYTSTSALWGLFCLPDRAGQKHGCIVKTRELGFMFVSTLEDLNMSKLED